MKADLFRKYLMKHTKEKTMARTKGSKNKVKKTAKKKTTKKVIKRKTGPVKKKKTKATRKKSNQDFMKNFIIVDGKGQSFRENEIFELNSSNDEQQFGTRAEAKAFLKQLNTDHANGMLPSVDGSSLESAEIKQYKDLYTLTYGVTDKHEIVSELVKLPLPPHVKTVSIKEAINEHAYKMKLDISILEKTIKGSAALLKDNKKKLSKFLSKAKAYKG